MKVAEKILASLTIVALILKLFSISGSTLILVFSLLLLSLMFYFFGFAFFNNIKVKDIFKKESYTGLNALNIFMAIASGFAISLALIGIMLKIQSWPGAYVTLLTSLISIALILIFSIILYQKSKFANYKIVIIRMIIYGIVSLAVFIFHNIF